MSSTTSSAFGGSRRSAASAFQYASVVSRLPFTPVTCARSRPPSLW
ncbi:MAG: hypothetical protein U1F20_04130 [Lysobacterales bacterium]